MGDYIVAKKMSTIALTGGRAFLCLLAPKRRIEMIEAISKDEQFSRACRDIDNVLALKRARLKEENKSSDTIEYRGHVLDKDKLIEALLELFKRKAEKLRGEAGY